MIPNTDYILTKYGLSPYHGFLPDETPLERLSHKYYEPWESVMENIADLIATKNIRHEIDMLPILDTLTLSSEAEWRRAYSILSFFTHAYIWGGSEPAEVLPLTICQPLLDVAEHFDLPCTATYAALNLWNWTPKFVGADLTIPDNIRMLHTFTGTPDEEWFYLISVAVEAEGAKIMPAMLECFEAVIYNNALKVTQLLNEIAARITKLGHILERMHEGCEPDIFYHRIRPFLAGSKGMEAAGLPNGVFYDEGDGYGRWRQYSGGSNAQSSLIQLLDIMLGVEHYATDNRMSKSELVATKKKQGYIEEMRRYMPGQHRDFLHHISTIANIRPFAMQHGADASVRRAYTKAIDSLTIFRDKHIHIVARYVIAPSRKQRVTGDGAATNIATASLQGAEHKSGSHLCGTGGTHLIPFLKQTRDETKAAATQGGN